MENPVIIGAVRTPVGKAKKGNMANYRPDDFASIVIKGLLERVPDIPKEDIDDIILGCAMPEGEQGMNVANIAKFNAGLSHKTSALTINRFCSSGLQALTLANDSILAKRNDIVIAGGVESMSLVPMGGNKFSPNPALMDEYPEVYLNMGNTAERVAEKYNITREEQDRFAYESNMKAVNAIKEDKFKEEVIPVEYEFTEVNSDQKRITKKIVVSKDEGPRADTNTEVLGTLKTPFRLNGSVTAGNSSQMSDGAAVLLVVTEKKAKQYNISPLARLVAYSVAGVPPEIMGIGPIEAIPKALKQANLKLKDIGLVELNEAFAAQSLAIIKELSLDPGIVNVNGGAISLGHPLGATGAILSVKLIHEMKRRNVRFGLISMCIGGGMGAAGIIENLSYNKTFKQKKK